MQGLFHSWFVGFICNQVSFRITLPEPIERNNRFYMYVNNRDQGGNSKDIYKFVILIEFLGMNGITIVILYFAAIMLPTPATG